MDTLDALNNIQKNENEKPIGIRIIKIGDDPIEIQEISNEEIFLGQTEKSIQVMCPGHVYHIDAGKTALLEILAHHNMLSCEIILVQHIDEIKSFSTQELMETMQKDIPLLPMIITRTDVLDTIPLPTKKTSWNTQHKFSAPKPHKGNISQSKNYHQRKK
ncbi:MAG: hypothetical protein WCH65_02915 [bacterium]